MLESAKIAIETVERFHEEKCPTCNGTGWVYPTPLLRFGSYIVCGEAPSCAICLGCFGSGRKEKP